MFHFIPTAARIAALGALLIGAAAFPARAQFSYTVPGSEYVAGTYTSLGGTGSAIVVPNNDDANSTPQSIGFPFSFDGQSFTQFVLNTNGFIKLGTATPSTATLFYADPVAATDGLFASGDPADVNLIAPFCVNLEPAAAGTPSFRVATSGITPDRVCTIQWMGLRDKITPPGRQLASIEFQVKLYETTNKIEFVYGDWTASTGTSAFRAAEVGLKGSTGVIVVRKRSAETFGVAFFQDTPYDESLDAGAAIRFNYRQAGIAASGDTYRFSVPQANDLSVAEIYSLGKLPIPIGVPHTASAVVINKGSNARASVAVTLSVTGATTFTNTRTLTNVQPGDTVLVTFAPYTPAATGVNTLTVSVPADDNTSNDSQQWLQQATANTFRYADDGPATERISIGSEGVWVVKYNTNTARSLLSVGIGFSTDATIVGDSYHAILTDDQGNILAQSADYTIATADLGAYHTFTFPTTPAIAAGDFYVGMAEDGTTGLNAGLGFQTESIVRPDAYFVGFDLVGGGLLDIATSGFPLRPMIEATLGNPPACAAPVGLAVSNVTSSGATVTFAAVPGVQNYTVFYGLPGFTPGGAGSQQQIITTTTLTLTGLTSSTGYQVYVRANCSSTSSSANAGPVAFATTCQSAAISTFPYVQNFDTPAATQQLVCGISVVDANNDGFTWAQFNRDTLAANNLVGTPRSMPNFMGYLYNAASAANDWFFLPAIQVPAGQQLRASWWQAATYGAGQVWNERLEVKWGTAPTVAAMTNTVYPATVIDDTTYTQASSQPITGTGTIYVGFHCISDADELLLRIDDVVLDRLLSVNDPAVARAVSVYPNPSTGQLNVQVIQSGATRVALRVLDNLGRVVYTGSMHDNAVKTVDLSTLSNGLYTVQVTLNDQVVTKQVNVLK